VYLELKVIGFYLTWDDAAEAPPSVKVVAFIIVLFILKHGTGDVSYIKFHLDQNYTYKQLYID